MNQKTHVSLSKGYKIKYVKGRWYRNYIIINNYFSKITSFYFKLKTILNYIRFSYHLSYSLHEMNIKLNKNKIKIIVFFLLPFGIILALSDKFKKRVN